MGRKPPHEWTQEEKEILRREYQPERESRRELATRLAVTEGAMNYQAGKMGLQKTSGRRHWTPEENETLIEMVERKSVVQIAKTLNRSINAVTVHAKRLNASMRKRNGWYTMGEAAGILGASQQWVRQRIDNGSLRATQHRDGGQMPGTKGSPWHIEEQDLREFIRQHPQDLNGRSVDMVQLVEILIGLSPEKPERRNGAPESTLTPVQIRTSDGRLGFGMETKTADYPPALVALTQEPELSGIWRPLARVDADELAKMMENRMQTQEQKTRTA